MVPATNPVSVKSGTGEAQATYRSVGAKNGCVARSPSLWPPEALGCVSVNGGRVGYSIVHLERLVAVVNAGGSYASAADESNKEGALRRAVDEIAQSFGLSRDDLIHQAGPNSVQVTPTGSALASEAARMLNRLSDFDRHMRGRIHDLSGEIRLALYPAHALRLGAVIASYQRDGGMVKVNALEDAARRGGGRSMLEGLRSRDLDLAIAPSDQDDADTSGLQSTSLYSWELVAFDPAELLSAHGGHDVTVEDLEPVPLLTSPPGHRSRSLLEAKAAERGIRLDFAVASSNTDALLALAAARVGVAVVPDDAIPPTTYRESSVPRRPDESAWLRVVDRTALQGEHSFWYRRLSPAKERSALEKAIVKFVGFARSSLRAP